MSLLQFQHVGIKGVAACVPRQVIDNLTYTQHFSADEAREVTEKTGIYQRRFAPAGVTSADLCFHAAEGLLRDLKVDRPSIDLLIFVSQTPDYRMPASAILLQHRLGLSLQTAAFDISLGCSGFVYGLSVVFAMLEKSGLRRALLLNGETRSRVYSPKDRTAAYLFGDGGTAVLVERDEQIGASFFSLNSDGSRGDLIKMKAGGYRFPSSPETFEERVVDQYGNIRSDEHGELNGPDVFNFAIREVPADIQRLLEFAGQSQDGIDYFVFHQANAYMNGYLQKKLKIPTDRFPATVGKFGNTSSVSIPLTIASELRGKTAGKKKLLLCGFGVGMSWASAIMETVNTHIAELIEI